MGSADPLGPNPAIANPILKRAERLKGKDSSKLWCFDLYKYTSALTAEVGIMGDLRFFTNEMQGNEVLKD